MKSNRLISVLIPIFNSEKYIKECIDSVLNQDYRPIEIVIVDDGSTDNSYKIVKSYKTNLIKYYYQQNQGNASARNLCFEKSTGDFIAFLDSDDYFLPGKLSAQIRYLSCYSDAELVFTKFINFYFTDYSRKEISSEKYHNLYGYYPKQEDKHQCTLLARRQLIEKVGPRNTDLVVGNDLEWLYRMKYKYNINLNHFIDNVYYMRRCHPYGIQSTNKHHTSEVKKIIFSYIRNNIKKSAL
ncbi:MAG: glycosyltransferase family 2 protein [Desulfovibrio sp.]|nr:glycosyltransferase family 2 protein [Desulfovibrio sp.]